MPTEIRAYRVFIASPGGLETERQTFRDAVQEYNEVDAVQRGLLFIPVGWETALGGLGNPQTFINEDVRHADYFVLVLGDRWGSPPEKPGEGKYTSGTEAEYRLATECVESSDYPLRQIVVFFKAVDPARMSDPGDQLRKVLEFRRSLETEKTLFFHTFDEIDSFKKRLRRYLAEWVRQHEDEQKAGAAAPVPTRRPRETAPAEALESLPRPAGAAGEVPSRTLAEAERLIKDGRLTDAEVLLAGAAIKGDSPDAVNAYGHFLQRVGRLAQAQDMYERLLGIGQQTHDDAWQAVAYGNLGLIHRTRDNLDEAEKMLQKSLEINERLRRREAVASDYGNLALVHLERGNLREAEDMLQKSVQINRELGLQEGLASDYGNLALIRQMRGRPEDLTEAENMLRESLRIYERLGRDDGVARSNGSLGLIHRTRGKFQEAEEMLQKSLEINERLGQLEGMASDYGNLGLVYLERGDLDKAESILQQSLEVNERLGRLGSVASDYGSLGVVHRSRGDLDKAETMLRMGLEINERVGRFEGMANQCTDLGLVYQKRGDPGRAQQLWEKARDLYAKVGIGVRVEYVQSLLDRLRVEDEGP